MTDQPGQPDPSEAPRVARRDPVSATGDARHRGLRARAKGVFMEVLETAEPERPAVISRACGQDATLMAEVKALLAAYDRSVSATARGTRAGAADRAESDGSGTPGGIFNLVGTTVGPGARYTIVERLGEGGFGEVYRAEQHEPVRRQVAFKILKPGMDSRAVIARFEQERQALALMDHPNIARVLDAGQTESGRPYFVMELVRGAPITEYCDSRQLTIRERLRLFVQVCHAVQHAHQKGVIHRDIKPSNVMVTFAAADAGSGEVGQLRTERGARGRWGGPGLGEGLPKVIDFGIAKATGARLTDKTLFTDFRVLLGTPEYMSPEQAEGSGGGQDTSRAEPHGVGPRVQPGDIDTRSDIYALGVLLYELLTGTTPLDRVRLRALSLAEIQRVIREEDPPRPSTRVGVLSRTGGGSGSGMPAQATADPDRTAPLGDRQVAPAREIGAWPGDLRAIARQRATDEAGLARMIRGDLDWIVMKAMEKDRARRYESAAALAADIERHLRDETVLATPPSAAYRARKLLRRHRVAFAAGGAVALALVLGLALSLFGLYRAASERDEKELALAAEARQRAAAVLAAEQSMRRAYRASIAAAQAGLQLGDGAAASRRLDAAPEELRAWEWWYLRHQLDRSRRRENLGSILGAGVVPKFLAMDGEYLVLGSAAGDGSGEVYNWVTRERRPFDPSPTQGLLAMSVSPRRDRLMLCGSVASALHDLSTGRLLRTFDPAARFEFNPFSPDGTLLVVGMNAPWRVAIIDARTGAELRAIPSTINRRPFPSFAPEGSGRNEFAMELDDNTVAVLDASTLKERLRVPGAVPRFSPDGSMLLCIDGLFSTQRLVVYDAKTGAVRGTLDLSDTFIASGGGLGQSIATSPDGSLIALMRRQGAVSIHDALTMRRVNVLTTSSPVTTAVGYVGFSRDGSQLAAVSSDLTLHVWDTAIGADPLEAPAMADVATSAAAVSTDARWVATGDWGRVVLWDAETGEPVWSRFHSLEFVEALSFSPDGRRLAVAGERGTVSVLDASTGSVLASAVPAGFGVFGSRVLRSVGWNDAETLLVGTGAGSMLALDAEELSLKWRREFGPEAVDELACAKGGAIAAVLRGQSDRAKTGEARVVIVDGEVGEARYVELKNPRSVVWDGGGTRLAIVGRGSAMIVNAAGAERRELDAAPGLLSAPVFSPDGSRLVAASSDGLFILWDARSGELVAEFPQSSAATCRAAAFTSSGSAFVAQSGEFAVQRLDTRSAPGSVLATRESVRRARALITRLREEVFDSPEIAERLRADMSIADDVRAAALRINAAMRDHAASYNNSAFMISAAEPEPRELQRGLKQTELAMSVCDDPFIVNTRAMMLYRAGRFEEALVLLDAAEAGYLRTRPGLSGPMPQVVAFRCMALARLGRHDEARPLLERLKTILSNESMGTFGTGWLAECEKLVK